MPPRPGDPAELVAGSDYDEVASERPTDVQRLLIPPLGVVPSSSRMGDPAEVVVGRRQPWLRRLGVPSLECLLNVVA